MNRQKPNIDVAAGPGIQDSRRLPDVEFTELWDSIILDEALKTSILCQAILNFTIRGKVDRAILPMHGIMLLVGKPGTGKTSLAKGLASRTAESLRGIGNFTYLEVEPHSLGSSALGKTQKAVSELFGATIAEAASVGPTIVLLDEVETIIADRSKLSLEANPVDVHRATDAALVQLDQLAKNYPNLLIIATSNFPEAIDSAFVSRSDLVVTVPMPNESACRQILHDTVQGLAVVFPTLKKLTSDPAFSRASKASVGLDGRQIRKVVARACAMSTATAIDPGKLTASAIIEAIESAKRESLSSKGERQ